MDVVNFTPHIDELSKTELPKFGLIPAGFRTQIFANEISLKAVKIAAEQYTSDFDHRLFLPERDLAFKYLLTEEYRRGYACFKFAVAKALHPKTIIEIGVGAGTGAIAMLHGSPESIYIGIDDNSKCQCDGWDFTGFVKEKMLRLGFHASFIIQDSMTLKNLPVEPVDLVHVDGDHKYENALNDSLLAFRSGSKWILVDDSRDLAVVRGAFDALEKSGGGYEWAYFDDTWTGNLLFCKK